MAENWGITINAEDLSNIKTVDQINAVISKSLTKKMGVNK
jgi:acyl carrier protein